MTKRITFSETDHTSKSTHPTAPSGETSLPPTLGAIELMRVLIRKRRVIIGTTLVVSVIAFGLLFLIPNKYTSEASLLPSGAQDKMADLKRLAGFGSLSMSDENSSELFPEILRSRSIQDSVLAQRYHFMHNARPLTVRLNEYFDQQNPDKLRERLNDVTYISLDKKTGVIDIAVETEYPDLSRQVLTAYLSALESFNLYARRSAARDNAQYLGRQIDRTKVEMAAAEDSLESYQAANRNWLDGSSPDLLKTIARLQREVEIQNKKYLYLTQEYEIAKLDAQKDVPIMRILDEPSLPAEKSSPKRGLWVLTLALMTGLLSMFTVVAKEVWRRRIAFGPDQAVLALAEDLREAFPHVDKLLRTTKKADAVEEVTV